MTIQNTSYNAVCLRLNASRFNFLVKSVSLVVFLCFLPTMGISAQKKPIDDKKAILAIIGEAESEGFNGMMAVACAIRNRGTLKGVYGLNAPRVKAKKYSQKTYSLAKLAWEESVKRDITRGATHWENTKAFGNPYWSKDMKVTIIIGSHTFYKER